MPHSKIFQDYYKRFKAFIDPNPHDQKGKERFVIQYSYEKLTLPAKTLLGILAEFSPDKGIPSKLVEGCGAGPPVWLVGSNWSMCILPLSIPSVKPNKQMIIL